MKIRPIFSIQLLLTLVVVALICIGCGDDDPISSNPSWHWSPLGDGLPGSVWDVESYAGRLYAGGEFQSGNSDGLRVFGGRTWSRVGDTLAGTVTNGAVFDLTTFNNQLIVTGDFSSTQPISTSGIAAWDGHSWSVLGDGLPPGMAGGKMAVYDGKLYVGNFFWLRDFRLIVWDGSSWTTVKFGGTGHVRDMCVYDGKLIVIADSVDSQPGGAFVWPWIRAWDGSTWTDMSSGSVSANALAVRLDTLYLCELYTGDLRAWTGSTWETKATATFEDDEHAAVVSRLTYYDDKLVVAGDFDYVNGTACGNIATWDGTTFAPLSCGVTGQRDPFVRVLKVFDERLYVGGTFTTIGTVESPGIAEWSYR